MLRKLCILTGPQTRGQNQKWLPHPCLLGGHKWAQVLRKPCILSSPKQMDKIRKSCLIPAFSGAAKNGQKCYVTLVFSGVPKHGIKLDGVASHLPSRGPKSGRNCYKTHAFSGLPKQGGNIKTGCLTLALPGAQKGAEILRHLLPSDVSPNKGTKSEVVASPLFFKGPKEGGSAMQPPHSQGSPKQGTT